MAVPCPGCGRQYDVALFQFGRTIHCRCGARVALAPRVERVRPAAPPRFSVDAMLGGLARWLRLIGCDAAYEPDVPDERLVRSALEEGRVILTRDRSLPREWSVPHCLVLESEVLVEQLREVVRTFDLEWRRRLFTRCSRCNRPLEEVPREAVAARVPPRVWRKQRRFLRCPGCARVYWGGSHVERMRRRLEEALGPPGGDA